MGRRRSVRKSVAAATGLHGFFSGKRDDDEAPAFMASGTDERIDATELRDAVKRNDDLKVLSREECAGLSAFMTIVRLDEAGDPVVY